MAHDAIWPQRLSAARAGASAPDELPDPVISGIIEFFEAKGLAALKREDGHEQWYDDWIACQAAHQLYASVLSPKCFSSCGRELDLLRLARVLEALAYFS